LQLQFCSFNLPSCLSQETAKEPQWFSSQAATCYYQSNYSNVEAIPLRALPKDRNKRICWLIFTLSLEAANTIF